MMIFKCKMCGGDIQAEQGATHGTCDSCGVTSTLPKAGDDRLVNLFNRANHLRQQCEFDKALANYENILNEDNSHAEAHWCAVLCRYGIEYVEDPKTRERIPTLHRVQYDSILSDGDYLAALENAPDSYTRELYENEAKKINEIQKGILAISSNEQHYDVFICYKESTDGGSRTKDSVLAQDIYYQLDKAGYKVFFARITLESKLGQQYEPYIFAALNSAKVMLVIGTKPEYFNAVWVKNEWSRFVSLLKKDRSKLIIPCYRDMDAYEIPEELSIYQAQDMGKIGFIQDLIHGVKKVLDTEEKTKIQTVSASPSKSSKAFTAQRKAKAEPLMKRGYMLLENKEWDEAWKYFTSVLWIDEDLSEYEDDEMYRDFATFDDVQYEYVPALIGRICADWEWQLTEFDKHIKEVIIEHGYLSFDKSNFRELTLLCYMLHGLDCLQQNNRKSADIFFNKVIKTDVEYAPGYIGKLLVELHIPTLESLEFRKFFMSAPLSSYKNYQRAIRFGDAKTKIILESYNKLTIEAIEEQNNETQEQERIEEEKQEEQERQEKEEQERLAEEKQKTEQEVTVRQSSYASENKSSDIAGMKVAGTKKILGIIGVIIAVIIIVVVAVNWKDDIDYITIVKENRPFVVEGYNVSYNTIIDKYFDSPQWEKRKDGNKIYIDISGKVKGLGAPMVITISVTKGNNSDAVSVNPYSVTSWQGDSISGDIAVGVLLSMFDAYDKGYTNLDDYFKQMT